MDKELKETIEKMSRDKGVPEESITHIVEMAKHVYETIIEAWEEISEAIQDFISSIYETKEKTPPVPCIPIPPLDTTKMSQVIDRKPLVTHIRNHI